MKKYKMVLVISLICIFVFLETLVFFGTSKAFSPENDIPGIEDVAQSFAEFKIPDDVKVVGIGEATHGNREFQIVKGEVLKKVVDEGNGRCICFEMAVGDAAMINDAIHDENSDLVDIIGKQSYPLYDTEEMVQVLSWMKEINKTLPYEKSLMFYGVDMQGAQTAIIYMKGLCEKNLDLFTEAEKEKILSIKAETKADYAGERDFFQSIYERLSAVDDLRYKQLSLVAKVVLQNIDAPDFDKKPHEFAKNRDVKMAENLKSYSEIEEARGYSQVIITAHNAHVMKGGSTVLPCEDADTMGDQINKLFEESYFCIGTEFYQGLVNIHTAGTYDNEYHRADHFYCSEDPLAFQANKFEDGTYCLDFSKVTDENSKVYKLTHSYIFNGIIGEGYTPAGDLAKSERVKTIPSVRYDAVIYYYNVTPIDPINF